MHGPYTHVAAGETVSRLLAGDLVVVAAPRPAGLRVLVRCYVVAGGTAAAAHRERAAAVRLASRLVVVATPRAARLRVRIRCYVIPRRTPKPALGKRRPVRDLAGGLVVVAARPASRSVAPRLDVVSRCAPKSANGIGLAARRLTRDRVVPPSAATRRAISVCGGVIPSVARIPARVVSGHFHVVDSGLRIAAVHRTGVVVIRGDRLVLAPDPGHARIVRASVIVVAVEG